MEVEWFFGAEKEGFVLDESGEPRSATGKPFHGIVGLGMRDLLIRDGVPAGVWLRDAHLGFEGAAHDPQACDELAMLRRCAGEAEALSFGESAAALRLYLAERCALGQGGAGVMAWNVKEGHTSSVWRVVIEGEQGHARAFAVNVGRDRVASTDLRATSERMRAIKWRRPDINMAAVLDISSVRLERPDDDIDVTITLNEWVADSIEIHHRPIRDGDAGEYLLVEHFLTSPTRPAQIVSVYGRRCTDDERRRIDADLARFRAAARTASVDAPSLDLQQGDAVWTSREAVVVAIS